ncbi:hypothetical protein J1N35_040910 [Gossypium stocksii]|uniref:Uncharacterized protein n=1 Tax=Gossypium stocksii TaxID=47602 RepID=A0A9D3UEH4_9ROSI|nr:hypothetical protein J1N35_040910 [Gossypium stocksii]
MLDKMTQMMTMLREISEALPQQEEVVHDFRIGNRDKELNITKGVTDPINIGTEITVDVATNIKLQVTTNMELKLILNESVKEPMHFIVVVEKVPVEEVDEFDSFSSSKGNKA